jgi:hypothetical protein
MRQNELTERYGEYTAKSIAAFLNALSDNELCYTSLALDSLYGSAEEAAQALSRAMLICINAGESLHNHFRAVYIFNNSTGHLLSGWRMSKLAFLLALINGQPGHPVVSRMQIRIINQILNR